ncbi:MAG TPA: hypothetical protein VIP11_08120, partial [Gemmatimonadaceae bacterium]
DMPTPIDASAPMDAVQGGPGPSVGPQSPGDAVDDSAPAPMADAAPSGGGGEEPAGEWYELARWATP